MNTRIVVSNIARGVPNAPHTINSEIPPAIPMSRLPSNPHLPSIMYEPTDPSSTSHPLSSTDSLVGENLEREHVYDPGHFPNSQLLLTMNAVVDDNTCVRTEDDPVYPTVSADQLAGPPATAAVGLGILPPPNEAPIRALQPLTVHPTPNPSIIAELEAPVCERLISRTFSPHELIPLIEEIFTRKDEVNMISCLDKDAAQAFIDVVHEVRPVVLHLCGAA